MEGMEKQGEALRRITEAADVRWKKFRWHSAFENLIFTILSQNTSDRNSLRALESLRTRIGLVPSALAAASVDRIRSCIRSAGLYNRKAPRIKKIARLVLDRYPTGLEAIFSKSEDEIRDELMKIEGVGPKTVDILLAFSASRDVFPVDTHVNRIAIRLGIAKANTPYSEVREALEQLTLPGTRVNSHLALIWHGRNICTARKPRCGICAASALCPSSSV